MSNLRLYRLSKQEHRTHMALNVTFCFVVMLYRRFRAIRLIAHAMFQDESTHSCRVQPLDNTKDELKL